jgi:hypothetical protein
MILNRRRCTRREENSVVTTEHYVHDTNPCSNIALALAVSCIYRLKGEETSIDYHVGLHQ